MISLWKLNPSLLPVLLVNNRINPKLFTGEYLTRRYGMRYMKVVNVFAMIVAVSVALSQPLYAADPLPILSLLRYTKNVISTYF